MTCRNAGCCAAGVAFAIVAKGLRLKALEHVAVPQDPALAHIRAPHNAAISASCVEVPREAPWPEFGDVMRWGLGGRLACAPHPAALCLWGRGMWLRCGAVVGRPVWPGRMSGVGTAWKRCCRYSFACEGHKAVYVLLLRWLRWVRLWRFQYGRERVLEPLGAGVGGWSIRHERV